MPSMNVYAAACVLICLCSNAMGFALRSPSVRCGGVAPEAASCSWQVYVPTSRRALRERSTRMLAQGFGSKPDKAKKQAPRIPAASKPCPCFSGKPYEECCKPIHDGEKSPQPVEVMRARYSAFACRMPQYIMRSTHPEHLDFAKPGWQDDILIFCNNYRFTGLEVSAPEEDPDTPGKVFVYFKAMMAGAECGGAVSFDERSIFLLKDGEWLYKAPDENYDSSVDVISKRRYNRTARVDKPKGATQR